MTGSPAPLHMGRSASKVVGRVTGRVVVDCTRRFVAPSSFLVSVMVETSTVAEFERVTQ
jgi:hypothetical protein